MRAVWRTALGVLLVASLLAVVLAAALLANLPYDHITLILDGERIELPPVPLGHGVVAALVAGVVVWIVALVVPAAVALALSLPLLVVGALLAIALSPLLLLVLVVAWLVRRARRRTMTA